MFVYLPIFITKMPIWYQMSSEETNDLAELGFEKSNLGLGLELG